MTTKVKPAQRLTAQRKLELDLATRSAEASVGETRSVRQYGLHLDDLRQIEQTIESAALAALKVQSRHGRLPTDVSPERILHLEQELTEKTRAPAELSIVFTVLEKKEREGSRPALPAGHGGHTPGDAGTGGRGQNPGLAGAARRQLLQVSPRTLQRWRGLAQPKAPAAPRPWPTDALTRGEATATMSVIQVNTPTRIIRRQLFIA
jgi:hypothetical protein